MYPLSSWSSIKRGYRFRQATWYTRYHLGVDYIVPNWTPVYAPFNGNLVVSGFKNSKGQQYSATQGFHVWFKPNHDNVIMRFMHLIQPGRGTGPVRQGDIIGYVGSTGLSTGPHLHLDISRGKVDIYNINNFIDPDTYNWNWTAPTPPPPPPTTSFRVTVLRTGYVRSQPRLSAPLSGSRILYPGDTFTGVAVVEGDMVSGINKWIKSSKGNYFWSGNARY